MDQLGGLGLDWRNRLRRDRNEVFSGGSSSHQAFVTLSRAHSEDDVRVAFQQSSLTQLSTRGSPQLEVLHDP